MKQWILIILCLTGLLVMVSCSNKTTGPEEPEFDPGAGLIAYYPFNGNANDESGNDNHGVVHNAELTEDRFSNQDSAYYFDGEAYIDIGDLTQLENAEGITISCWIMKMSDNRVEGFIGKWRSRTQQDNVFLLYNGEVNHGDSNMGGFWFAYDSVYYSNHNVSGESLIPQNEWIHIAAVWRNSDGFTAIYKNGIVDNFTYNTNSVYELLNYHTSYTAAIGNWGYPHGVDYNLIGSIDEVRIYNKALNSNEIQALYLLQD